MRNMPDAKKILITGTHGFVGTRAMVHYKNAVAVPSSLTRNAGDALSEFVKAEQPDVIINAAAISDIGACEKDPDGSFASNVTLPVTLAKAACDVGAKLISFSSDQVYTGCKDDGPYSESDILPPPTNVYARHKLEGEQKVLDISPDAILLRATWMYDMPLYGDGGLGFANRGNFIMNTLRSVINGAQMSFSSRDYRGITYVRQVVSLLDKMIYLPGGVYNYGSENELCMLDTAKALLSALGLERKVIDNGRTGHNLWMNCEKLKKQGVFFDTTAEGFLRCVRDYDLN